MVLVVLSVIATGVALVTHLALRFQNVAMGYKVQSARDEAARLRERVNQLRIELSALRSPQALTDLARSELGMVEPDRVATFVTGRNTSAQHLSGSPR